MGTNKCFMFSNIGEYEKVSVENHVLKYKKPQTMKMTEYNKLKQNLLVKQTQSSATK